MKLMFDLCSTGRGNSEAGAQAEPDSKRVGPEERPNFRAVRSVGQARRDARAQVNTPKHTKPSLLNGKTSQMSTVPRDPVYTRYA